AATGQSLYLALWAGAFEEVASAASAAGQLLSEPSFDRRYPAALLLSQVGIADAAPLLIRCLSDADLRIAFTALRAIPNPAYPLRARYDFPDIFENLQELFVRTPQEKVLEPAIWPWNQIYVKRAEVASLLI